MIVVMVDNKRRLPSRKRSNNPPAMRLTERDVDILLTIHAYDGMLSVDQVHRWFFPGEGNKRNAQRRLSLLFHNTYIRRPQQNEQYLTPEPIVWLDKKGAQVVALKLGTEYRDPEFKWRNSPRWRNIAHDILLNEFRYMTTRSAEKHLRFSLREWRGQNKLQRLFQEPIAYRDMQSKERKKLVWPDGFFYLEHSDDQGGLPLLVELDNATESNVRFAREKVSPNLHLMLTETYREEFEVKTGRVLAVMIGSQERYDNIRKHVTNAGGAMYFLFTRYEWLTDDNILSGDVWQLPHNDDLFSLGQYRTPEFQSYLEQTARGLPEAMFLQQPMI